MKYTKGEWSVTINKVRYPKEEILSINVISNKETVCCISGKNQEQAKSNAKLIAAAPEMIELLNEIFETVNLSDHSMDLYKRTESLIKKAIK